MYPRRSSSTFVFCLFDFSKVKRMKCDHCAKRCTKNKQIAVCGTCPGAPRFHAETCWDAAHASLPVWFLRVPHVIAQDKRIHKRPTRQASEPPARRRTKGARIEEEETTSSSARNKRNNNKESPMRSKALVPEVHDSRGFPAELLRVCGITEEQWTAARAARMRAEKRWKIGQWARRGRPHLKRN